MSERRHRCDGCGEKIDPNEYFTDDTVCKGSDGPGFFLCGAAACQEKIDRLLSATERADYYGKQRKLNLIAERAERASEKHARKCEVVRDHVAIYGRRTDDLAKSGLTVEAVLAVLEALREMDSDLAGNITDALEEIS